MENLNLFRINTSSWIEEDFLILTSLTEQQIVQVIRPIVIEESKVVNGDAMYSNEDYVYLLQERYPSETIIHYTFNGIETISFNL